MIGGADLNKFAGVLEAEKNKFKKIDIYKDCSLVGYFISISGFKETAIEQERENNDRMILINTAQIVQELIQGKIIVSMPKATSQIPMIENIKLLEYADLIASDIGWIWVFYCGNHQKVTHFSLIHAEGNPLVDDLAKKIVSVDSTLNKNFEGLEYLHPKIGKDTKALVLDAKEKYFKYLENECGEIQFEGLPTDKDAGSVKVKLENIFEPLHLEEIEDSNEKKDDSLSKDTRKSFGSILKKNNRLAILAKPGGGKSTLLKRLAIAYSHPEKRKLIKDSLPKKEFFPIFIRCRELGSKVSSTITDIIYDIPNRAEINDSLDGFKILVSDALQSGRALLLIDGLDEISLDRDRINFVTQLRKFLSTYPNLNIITTSRKAGFRAIGGILADYCKQYEIANLSKDEIRELSQKWHKAIIDDSLKTMNESNELVDQILKDKRITALAENPLLLTTLLFVKRWAGYLPTKRHILYQEMIKLLLVTWNVEGHEQLDIDETEPQLAFVAYWMSTKGKQTLTINELKQCLIEARKEMPDILCYTKISPADFIKRVESRSSLLIMSGHKQLEDMSIVPIYEFLHLSFQEYLTAIAVVSKYVPQSLQEKTNLSILEPYILSENWKEIVPIVTVLAKRDNVELIEYLITKSKESAKITRKDRRKPISEKYRYAPTLLGNCIANEIQINPKLLNEALEWFAKNRYNILNIENTIEIIINSKFSKIFEELLQALFFREYQDQYFSSIGSLLAEVFILKIQHDGDCCVLKKIKQLIASNCKEDQCLGILALMEYAFCFERKDIENCSEAIYQKTINEILPNLLQLIKLKDDHYFYTIAWAIAWIYKGDHSFNIDDELTCELISTWLSRTEHNLCRVTAWAIDEVFFPTKQIVDYLHSIQNVEEKIRNKFQAADNEYDQLIAICLGVELNIEWEPVEVQTIFNELKSRHDHNKMYEYYFEKLGLKRIKE
jgi:hypothetical protein